MSKQIVTILETTAYNSTTSKKGVILCIDFHGSYLESVTADAQECAEYGEDAAVDDGSI